MTTTNAKTHAKISRIHYKKDLYVDTSDVISRLYDRDIKKRKESYNTLVKVYEPPFRPNVYKENIRKYAHVMSTIDNKNALAIRRQYNENHSAKKRKIRTHYDDIEDEEDENEHDEEDVQDRFREMLFFNKRKSLQEGGKNKSTKHRK